MKDYIYGKNAVANALISGQNIINLYMSPSFFDKKINQLIKEKHIKYIKQMT
ncbi:MAG: RNA methyltransferase substrate-binding domain-containing protein [Bacilli bacterium]|nr:RNA methyltransferase substrate-binding domain-containing protein [Bacilli bacterium]